MLQHGARQSAPVHPGRRWSAERSAQPRPAPRAVAVRGSTRVVYREVSTPVGQRRRAEPAGHGLGVIEHALMTLLITGMVILLIGAIGHSVHDLWQGVSNGLAR